ncbi:MAG: hypothetical protein Q9208_000798 [Pyrenodesmia sp. 3 TL-2023]
MERRKTTMSGNMVHTGMDLVPPLLKLGTVITTGLYMIKEQREQLELNEKTKSERQELEAKLCTAQIQLNAAKTQIKSLEADARKRQVAESRSVWRRVWQGSLDKREGGRLRDA